MKRILAVLLGGVALPLLVVGGLAAGLRGFASLSAQVEASFAAPTSDRPSRLYAQPFRIAPRMHPERDGIEAALRALAYRRVEGPEVRPGEVVVGSDRWTIGRRPFRGPDGPEAGGTITLRLDRRGRVAELRNARGQRIAESRLEPVPLGAIYGARAEDREPVALDEVPQHLVDAVLAMEDQRFFEHAGFDLPRVAGALVANVRAGRIVQGGSTITQQLAKNLYLSHERTWLRKLREALIALVLERAYEKPQILEAYLNHVYLGQDGGIAVHGVGSAARHYFGKDVRELTLAESALIAGILRGPSLYAPLRRPEAARARRDLVLSMLLAQGKISGPEHDAARDAPLSLRPAPPRVRSVGYFTDLVRQQLDERYGAERLERDGLVVLTSLDWRLQRLAERVVREGVAGLEERSPELERAESPLQAALVAFDPGTGDVLALVGGRDYARSQFDRATAARRQPGSVFKPVVALAALSRELGETPYTLATVLEDEPLTVAAREGEWEPRNHDRSFRGEVTLRQAVEDSLNVPMVKLALDVGLRRVVRTARRLGIQGRLAGVPSLALGTYEVTLLEMTRAYGVLAAQGMRFEPRTTLAVLDGADQLLERIEVERGRVFDPAETYLVTSLLQGVVDRGTGRALRARVRGAVAGKTGTTDDYRDAWFIGYTPELVVGVWVGFDEGTSLEQSGAKAALPIFASFLERAQISRPSRGFRAPRGIERVEVVAQAGHPSGLRCDGEPELFLAGTVPTEHCGGWGWLGERGYTIELDADVAAAPARPAVRRPDERLERDPRWAQDRSGGPRRDSRVPWFVRIFR